MRAKLVGMCMKWSCRMLLPLCVFELLDRSIMRSRRTLESSAHPKLGALAIVAQLRMAVANILLVRDLEALWGSTP